MITLSPNATDGLFKIAHPPVSALKKRTLNRVNRKPIVVNNPIVNSMDCGSDGYGSHAIRLLRLFNPIMMIVIMAPVAKSFMASGKVALDQTTRSSLQEALAIPNNSDNKMVKTAKGVNPQFKGA